MRFKQFLLEGGAATRSYETSRANQSDIAAAIKFVAKTLSVDEELLKSSLLGSTELTLLGKKKDSGDIDIALPKDDYDPHEVDEKMQAAVNGEGAYNAGTKVASYAVPVNGKKVQVDLMFIKNIEWAKFIYHSSLGNGSKYPGAVRNIMMFTVLTQRAKEGEDVVVKDDDGNVIARASRSIKMDSGLERLFKIASKTKTGYTKTLKKVEPDDVKNFLKSIGKNVSFNDSVDTIDDPKEVVEFIFGKGTKPEDVKTAEGVIKLIKKQPDATKLIELCKTQLEKLKMIVPEELK
jgi:hypothetical protein